MKTVFISGASSGIGEALAEEFAKHKFRLVLTARKKEKLLQIKNNLERKYQIPVLLFVGDLSKENEREMLCEKLKEKNIHADIAVNNAGAGLSGAFSEQPKEKIEEMIRLNMESLTMMTQFFLQDMKKRKHGKIINIASTGAYHPGPYTAVYYATKAYVLSFTEAVAMEAKKNHIQVTAVCPGAVKTNFARRAGRKDNALADTPEKIAKQIYKKAVLKHKRTILIGLQYRIWVKIPRKIAAFFIGRQQQNMLLK